MNYYGFVSLFNGVVALGLGIYFFFKNRKNAIYLSFSSFTIAVGFWAIFYSIWQSQDSKETALFFIRLAMSFCYFVPFAFAWFCRNLFDDNSKNTKIPAYFLIPAFFAAINFTPLLIKDVEPRLYFPYWPVPGHWMHFWIASFNLIVLRAFFLLFKGWARTRGNRRLQFQWVAVTTSLIWAGGSTNWFLWYNIPIPPAPNFFVAVFLLILAYAILRRGIFDLDVLAEIVREAKLSAIGMVAASLNHELRNPLYIVKGKIESQLDAVERHLYSSSEEEARKSREIFSTVLRHVDRAMDIIQRFSNFARPHPVDPVKETVPVREVWQDVLGLAGHEFKMQKIRLVEEPVNGLSVRANRRQLEEVLFNLVINACHAMEKTGGELRFKAHQPNGKVVLEISDTGPGIGKENQRRIFEPFYSTKAEKGTGLGLYITKKLVEENDGKIFLKSKPGEGTSFRLEFAKV